MGAQACFRTTRRFLTWKRPLQYDWSWMRFLGVGVKRSSGHARVAVGGDSGAARNDSSWIA
jgi:hypothetical protein